MTDDGVSFDTPGSGPHAVTDEWLSFEARMVRRRVGRCLLRAGLALEDGCAADARKAIDEARQLDPECPEIVELENRLRALDGTETVSEADFAQAEKPLAAPADDYPGTLTIQLVAGSGLRESWRWFVAILLTGSALGSYYWHGSTTLPETVTVSPADTDGPALPAIRIEQETVNAHLVTPDLAADEAAVPVPPRIPVPPIADVAPASTTNSVVLAVNRDVPPPASLPDTLRSDMRLDELPRTASPEAPARPAPAPQVSSVAPRMLATVAAPPGAEPEPIDESSIVRGVLMKYERAYSSLDADAASTVWPGVNRTALERAFDGLTSQRVSLQSCDVTVNGAAARALCSGTASWVPKIGGGARTAVRRWDFELRKRDGDWEIKRAVAR